MHSISNIPEKGFEFEEKKRIFVPNCLRTLSRIALFVQLMAHLFWACEKIKKRIKTCLSSKIVIPVSMSPSFVADVRECLVNTEHCPPRFSEPPDHKFNCNHCALGEDQGDIYFQLENFLLDKYWRAGTSSFYKNTHWTQSTTIFLTSTSSIAIIALWVRVKVIPFSLQLVESSELPRSGDFSFFHKNTLNTIHHDLPNLHKFNCNHWVEVKVISIFSWGQVLLDSDCSCPESLSTREWTGYE